MREQMTLNLPYPDHLHEEVAALRRELAIRQAEVARLSALWTDARDNAAIRYVEIVRLRTRARLAREAIARQDMQALAELLQGA